MFDHVTLHVSGRDASERFLRTVLPAIGAPEPQVFGRYLAWGDLSIVQASGPGDVTRRAHVGLVAPSREAVDAFWRAGVDAGYRSDGEPGPRPQYVDDYYGAFLLDPDGNSIEAMRYTGAREGGLVDHLWIRAADVAAARAFYAAAAPFAGYRHVGGRDGRETFSWGERRGSFSLVPATDDWPVTERLHVAFRGSVDDADGFWRTLTDAGHRDNGAPGPRPEYSPGYYGAFVLDPDGNNVEVVFHAP